MPFNIIQGDITTRHVDAIVNAANETLLGGGGVDGAIHRAAGPKLLAECRTLGGCRTGEAKLTRGYDLPASYVIHTVGPIWQGGNHGEAEKLASAYRNSLLLAAEHGFESVSFPLISAGAYGYPKARALRIAVETICEFLKTHEMQVELVVFDRSAFRSQPERHPGLNDYLARTLSLGEERNLQRRMFSLPFGNAPRAKERAAETEIRLDALELPDTNADGTVDLCFAQSLDERLQELDESFAQMLFRKIDERGMTDSACYKKANIDRKLFSKIRSNPDYRPSKATALAFAVALELPLEETKQLLSKAGFALSHASKFDVIVEYFIQKGNYDIFEINETLFAFDQKLLGA